MKFYDGNIEGKTFAVWGLSFKPKTNDMREAPSIKIIDMLLGHGAKIQAYDPQAMQTAKECIGDKISYAMGSYDVLVGANALILLTEWNEFRRPDFEKIKENVSDRVFFDGRNQFERNKIEHFGLKYICI